MTPPTDPIPPLQALVEAGQRMYRVGGHGLDCRFSGCTCGAVVERAESMTEWVRCLPAALEALERVEEAMSTLCHVVHGDDDELAVLKVCIAWLEEALKTARDGIRRAQLFDPSNVEWYMEIEGLIDDALEGRDE